MNLKQNPTKAQLRGLIASKHDDTGDHMIWVSFDGDVFLDTLSGRQMPSLYAERLRDRMQFRLETLMAGNGYVGPNAAKDPQWIDRIYTALLTNFEKQARGFIDTF